MHCDCMNGEVATWDRPESRSGHGRYEHERLNEPYWLNKQRFQQQKIGNRDRSRKEKRREQEGTKRKREGKERNKEGTGGEAKHESEAEAAVQLFSPRSRLVLSLRFLRWMDATILVRLFQDVPSEFANLWIPV